MAKQTITIDSILGGQSALQNYGTKGQYQSAIGIDPDFPISDSAVRASGYLRPTSMEKFSGSEVTGVPLWIITNPKNNETYVYANDGKIHNIDSNLAMGTALTAATSSSGNGSAYYDNKLLWAKNTDIYATSDVGGTPTVDQTYWTSTLGLTALTNTTYPSINGVEMPNHVMHRHPADNKVYICDVNSANQGILNFIKTKKTTVEGDTDNGSTYNALDFPIGYYPAAIESYGTDLAVALFEGTDTTISQAPAKVSFWDTTSSSFSKIVDVEFPDPLITAMKNVNGVLYVWSGQATGGYRVSRFVGGYSFQEVYYSEEGYPPLQGAVDHDMNKIIWGSNITDPTTAACVKSIGSKMAQLGQPVHTPFKATSAGANGWVTAVKYLEDANNSRRRPVIGWDDDSAKGLDKISTTYGTSVFRSEVFRVGQPFKITKIKFPLSQAVAANMTITPKIFIDDGSSSSTLTAINSTTFPNSERNTVIKPQGVSGDHDFFVELTWSGTALLTAALPISIEIETEDD